MPALWKKLRKLSEKLERPPTRVPAALVSELGAPGAAPALACADARRRPPVTTDPGSSGKASVGLGEDLLGVGIRVKELVENIHFLPIGEPATLLRGFVERCLKRCDKLKTKLSANRFAGLW
jgi:hypothetical protein